MKRLKIFVSTISIFFSIICLLSFLVILFSSINIKNRLIHFENNSKLTKKDTITVHFIHGSIPLKDCEYKKKRIGGYLGGHIEIEKNNNVYGFLYDSLPINYFPKENKNSKFESKTKKQWEKYTFHDKITSIPIPIDSLQNIKLTTILNDYLNETPYDYSFFGHRCTSSTAKILSDANIINKFNNVESIITFFYPRSLRKLMVKFAKKNSYEIRLKNGIDCQKWE